MKTLHLHPLPFFRSAAAVARRDPADTILTAGIRNQSAVRAVHGKNSCDAYRLKIARVHFELANFNPANATDKCDLHLLPLLFFRSATAPDQFSCYPQRCGNTVFMCITWRFRSKTIIDHSTKINLGEVGKLQNVDVLVNHNFKKPLGRSERNEIGIRRRFFQSFHRKKEITGDSIQPLSKNPLDFLRFFHLLHLLDILDDSFVMPPSRQDMTNVAFAEIQRPTNVFEVYVFQKKLHPETQEVVLPNLSFLIVKRLSTFHITNNSMNVLVCQHKKNNNVN